MASRERHCVKIAIVGAKNVGKTTIATLFKDFSSNNFKVYDPFSNDEESMEIFSGLNGGGGGGGEYVKRQEADLFTKRLKMRQIREAMDVNSDIDSINMNGDEVEATIWDTAGFETYGRWPPSNVLRGCDVLVVCFSCVDYSSMLKASSLVKYAADSGFVSRGCVCIALGTKTDLLTKVSVQPRQAAAETAVEGQPMCSTAAVRWVCTAYDDYYAEPSLSTTTTKKTARSTTSASLRSSSGTDVMEFVRVISDCEHLTHENWWVLGGGSVSLKDSLSSSSPSSPSLPSPLSSLYDPPSSLYDFSTSPDSRQALLSFTSATKVYHGTYVNPVYCIYHAIGLHLIRKVRLRYMLSRFDERGGGGGEIDPSRSNGATESTSLLFRPSSSVVRKRGLESTAVAWHNSKDDRKGENDDDDKNDKGCCVYSFTHHFPTLREFIPMVRETQSTS